MKLRLLIAALIPLTAAACVDAPPPPAAPLSFAQLTPYTLNVGDVQIIEEYHSSSSPPNVELAFPVSPAQAMRGWVKDRVRTNGSAGVLQVIIKNASVKETALPRTQGLKGVFTNDQATQWDARLEVEMRIYSGEKAMSDASLHVSASHGTTLPENASAARRDAVAQELISDLMKNINAELERNFQQYFSGFLSYGG